MAVMMECISSITVMARNTISAVYRVAEIVASLPNLLNRNKAWLFPFRNMITSHIQFKFITINSSLIFFIAIGFPWSIIPSNTSCHGQFRPWYKGRSPSHIFSCTCSIICLPLYYLNQPKSCWFREDTF